MNLGKALKNKRESMNISLAQLATKLCVSENYLRMIERGSRPLPLILAMEIADIMQITVSELVGVKL